MGLPIAWISALALLPLSAAGVEVEMDHDLLPLTECTYARDRELTFAGFVDTALERADSGWQCDDGPATCAVMLRSVIEVLSRTTSPESYAALADKDEQCGTKTALFAKVRDRLYSERVAELRQICREEYGGICE